MWSQDQSMRCKRLSSRRDTLANTMVMDYIIKKLNDERIFAQGSSDDLTISIRGKFDSTLGDQMRYSEKVVERWCRENGLKSTLST